MKEKINEYANSPKAVKEQKKKKDFFEKQEYRMNQSYLALIGIHELKFDIIFYFLISLNVILEFFFISPAMVNFFNPLVNNTVVAWIIAGIISAVFLILLEFTIYIFHYLSLRSFVLDNKEKFLRYLLIIPLIGWCANMYFTAVGGENMIKTIHNKPQQLKASLTDTITKINLLAEAKLADVDSLYNKQSNTLINEYNTKFNEAQEHINNSNKVYAEGRLGAQMKAQYTKEQIADKRQLSEERSISRREIIHQRDSLKRVVNRELSNNINNSTIDKAETGNKVFWFGWIIVLLAGVLRSFLVYAGAKVKQAPIEHSESIEQKITLTETELAEKIRQSIDIMSMKTTEPEKQTGSTPPPLQQTPTADTADEQKKKVIVKKKQ